MANIQEALENADEIAELTGRDRADVIADLLDDGKLNNSNDMKENTSAIEKATKMVGKTHKLLTAMIPILLLVATSGLELGGIIDLTPAGEGDEWMWEDEPTNSDNIYWGCMDDTADNYDSYANEDDGSCEWTEPEPECEASFYEYTVDWVNESNTTNIMEVRWDADWSCDATQYIEIDIYIVWHDNQTEYVSYTTGYDTTYTEVDMKTATKNDVLKGDSFDIRIAIWVDEGSWKKHDEELMEDIKSPQ